MNPLYKITTLNINYMSNLNFIDIVNLYETSTQFNNIDINTLLRQILYNKNKNIHVLPNYNIYTAVSEFYDQITNLIIINYPLNYLPDWVDKEKFINASIKKLMFDALYKIYVRIAKNIIENKELLVNNITITLGKDLIVSPLLPIGVDKTEYYKTVFKGIDNVNNNITLSDHFVNYIKDSIQNVYNENLYRVGKFQYPFRLAMVDVLETLLFIRS